MASSGCPCPVLTKEDRIDDLRLDVVLVARDAGDDSTLDANLGRWAALCARARGALVIVKGSAGGGKERDVELAAQVSDHLRRLAQPVFGPAD